MLNRKIKISTNIVLLISVFGLSACSTMSQVGKSARNLTTFGNSDVAGVDNELIIPPSLKLPADSSSSQAAVKKPQTRTTQATTPQARTQNTQPQRKKAASRSDGNYYIIVGTYPDQLVALDKFTQISSIGIKGATMESRQTKAGTLLHMVRLGPYTNQEDIDEAKDSLTNTGMTQYKIVKN